jgi:hypothetical protein
MYHSTKNMMAMKQTRKGVLARGIPPKAKFMELKLPKGKRCFTIYQALDILEARKRIQPTVTRQNVMHNCNSALTLGRLSNLSARVTVDLSSADS